MPVIALSAGAFPDEIEACREAGMCDHVAKPTTAEALCRRIAHWLDVRATREAGDSDALDDASVRVSRAHLDPLPSLLPDLPDATRERLIGHFTALVDESVGELRALSGVLAS